MSGWRSAFRWMQLSFNLPTSLFRWPSLLVSYVTPSWSHWNFPGPQNIRGWLPDFDFSVVDSVLWSIITAFESLALVLMLCCFFLFCGCTL